MMKDIIHKIMLCCLLLLLVDGIAAQTNGGFGDDGQGNPGGGGSGGTEGLFGDNTQNNPGTAGSSETQSGFGDGGQGNPGTTIPIVNTDVSAFGDIIYASDVDAYVGQRVTMSIKMKNASSATAYSFRVVLPNTIDMTNVEVKSLRTGMTVSSSVQADCSMIVNGSVSSGSVTAGNTEICSVTFTIPKGFVEDEYPIKIKDATITENGIVHPVSDVVYSKLTVLPCLLGDANADGIVSISDISYVIAYMLNSQPACFNVIAADANKDGAITTKDIIIIQDKLLGK